jgi:hypothetical protein
MRTSVTPKSVESRRDAQGPPRGGRGCGRRSDGRNETEGKGGGGVTQNPAGSVLATLAHVTAICTLGGRGRRQRILARFS